MGAGNYWFEAPSSEEWSEMLYVDLEPVFWSDEIKDRDEALEAIWQRWSMRWVTCLWTRAHFSTRRV